MLYASKSLKSTNSQHHSPNPAVRAAWRHPARQDRQRAPPAAQLLKRHLVVVQGGCEATDSGSPEAVHRKHRSYQTDTFGRTNNITSCYGSSCANNGKDALNPQRPNMDYRTRHTTPTGGGSVYPLCASWHRSHYIDTHDQERTMDTTMCDGVHAFALGRVYQCSGRDAKRHMGAHFHRRFEWCGGFYSPSQHKL